MVRGCSSDGRALQSHCRGQRFDSAQLHHAFSKLFKYVMVSSIDPILRYRASVVSHWYRRCTLVCSPTALQKASVEATNSLRYSGRRCV